MFSMNRIIRAKNNSGATDTWAGVEITDGEYYDLSEEELGLWVSSAEVFDSIGTGELIINKGADDSEDIVEPIQAWKWLTGDTLPLSKLDNTKLSVHPSYKPEIPGSATYAVWTGAGDEVDGGGSIVPSGVLGGGPLLHLNMEVDTPSAFIDVKFNESHGRVFLHEAYLKFTNAGEGDYIDGEIRAEGTPLQTAAQKNLTVDGDGWIQPATNMHLGELNGSHGFLDPTKIVLVPRTFSGDGAWDYDGVNLAPNYTNTGGYKMTSTERTIHRYVSKLPCFGDTMYFSITSDETTELPPHYFLRVTGQNVSNTNWHASFILEIYRQRTYEP